MRIALGLGALTGAGGRAVVAAALGFARAAAHRAHIFRLDHDGDGLQAVGKVVAGGGEDDGEGRLVHAVQSERRVGAVEEGADVKGRAGSVRHPGCIDLDRGLNGLQRIVGVELRQAQTLAGAVQAGDIFPRAEELHAAVGTAIGLQALKDLRAVVQHACRGGHADGAVGHDARIVPALIGAVVHEEHMVGEHGAEAETVGGGQRAGMRGFGDRDIHKNDLLSIIDC